jgi:hypothetical protein
MPIRSVVAPALAASLVSLAGQTFAGDAPPLFNWINPLGGDWSDPSNWDQNAVPGYGAFVDADVFINAPSGAFNLSFPFIPGPDITIALGHVSLDGPVNLSTGVWDFHTMRSLLLKGDSSFSFSRIVNVLEDLTVNKHARLRAADASIVVGGTLRNGGLLEWARGSIEATSVVNDGLITTTFTNPAGPREFIVSDAFINNGDIVMENRGFTVLGNMVQRGSMNIAASSGFTLNGNLSIEDGATFLGAGSITLENAPGMQRSVTGDLEHAGLLFFRGGGGWALEGDVAVANIMTQEIAPLDSIRIDGRLEAGSISLAATTADFHSVAAAGTTLIGANTISFGADASFGGPTELNAQKLSFGGAYSFADDLALTNATVHFAQGLSVGGDLSVLGSARVTTGQGTAVVVGGGNITWMTPSVGLDYALTASNQIVVGVPSINAPLTARQIRIVSAITDLNADLFVTDAVSIAGASVSIGAVGEIAQRTIHGDLTTTFSFAQAWDFDILGSGARGVAESDTLVIDGDATIYGFLRVNAIGGASALRAGDEFTLLTAALLEGSFRALSLPSLSNGLSFDLVYEPSAVRLVVVPAPGAALALGIACLAPIARRRRPRSRRWPLAES